MSRRYSSIDRLAFAQVVLLCAVLASLGAGASPADAAATCSNARLTAAAPVTQSRSKDMRPDHDHAHPILRRRLRVVGLAQTGSVDPETGLGEER